MKKSMTIGMLVAAGVALSGFAAPQDGRRMVWGDEFEGTTLDLSKWRFRATMNSSDCTYTNDARTARVENGCLHLLVVPSGNPAKPQMLSRGIATHDTMAFRYGYLEMRGRVPFRHGAWPSFWMTATPQYRKSKWTAEIDIFEVFSSTNRVVYNLHKWAPGKRHVMLPHGEGHSSRAFTFADGAKLNAEFHVYGFEWSPQEMSFWVDGQKYGSCPIDEAHDFSASTVPGMDGFHDFESVIFNNEIFTPGHGWCPEQFRITADDPLPIEYWIDWVRLWQKDGEEIRFPEQEKSKKGNK